MDAGTIKRIESGVCAGAAAVFAAAVAFAIYRWLEPTMVQPQLGAFAGVGAAIAFLPCWQILGLVDRREADFQVPMIDLGVAMPSRLDELVLTDADRFEEALLLDDELTAIAPDSRVVRLFDPKAMPTPGELKDRIDAHLDRSASDCAATDASQALYDALAELRIELPSRR